jgi:alanine racemase
MPKMTTGRAWVETDLDALQANFQVVRRAVGARTAIIAMVKADGYGLGAARVVRALDPLEPWGYGVAAAAEGAELRRAGVDRPIVVFSPLPPGDVEEAAEAGLVASISDLGALDLWARAAAVVRRPLDFHVEIDTGMGRAGFDWRDTPTWAPQIFERLGTEVRWTGVFTHFHGADAPESTPTAAQWARFNDAVAQLPIPREELMVHACNSAAALRWPEFAADAVRPGICLYGGDPAPGVGGYERPRPVASVRARVVRVQEVPPGATVGYGATHAARSWARWATLSIGYGDGLPRSLGNTGEALLHGRRVPIVGRVSMDLTVVDVTSGPETVPGDAATLIGRDGAEEITLEQVAGLADTISYEILTRLGRRLPRVEVRERRDR